MTVLYRCRTALSEVAQTFSAVPPGAARWSAEVWPGRTGLVVSEAERERRIAPMAWGVRELSLGKDRGQESRATAWFRELYRDRVDLLKPGRRCLIVLDSFAYPGGTSGARTRTWFGFEDRPIFAWAAFSSEGREGPAFCGLMVAANELVTESRAMPAIVAPSDCEAWLAGDMASVARIARTTTDFAEMYREVTEEPWSGERGGGQR